MPLVRGVPVPESYAASHPDQRFDLDVQDLVTALQIELRIRVVTGQIVLHLNDSRLQQVETKTFQRIPGKKDLTT